MTVMRLKEETIRLVPAVIPEILSWSKENAEEQEARMAI